MRWRDSVAGADRDRLWMDRALRVAERGLGLTSPNPAVGAVLVKDERVSVLDVASFWGDVESR